MERITPTQSATQHQVVTMIRVRCQNKITEVQLTHMTILQYCHCRRWEGGRIDDCVLLLLIVALENLEKNILFIKILRQKISNLCQIAAPHDYQSV